MIRTLFEYGPLGFFVLTMFVAIVPAHLPVRAQAVSAMVLLFAFSKFLCYAAFGGDAFAPDLPELLMWFWNGLYSAAVIFMAFACLWLPVALALHANPLTRQIALVALAAVSAGLAARGVWNGIKPPEVREVELTFEQLPPSLDGYRILHLSDLHVSAAARRARTEEVVRRANAAKADLIVLTGDIVDGDPNRRARDVEPLRRLSAPDGVWLSTGNHEFYFDWPSWQARYDRWGLRFLRNECVFPKPDLALAGVDDECVVRFEPRMCPSVSTAFLNAPDRAFRVLLRHRPLPFGDGVREGRVDLQLSGHTHGGIMPGLDRIVARHNRGYVRGLYRLGRSALSVSSGAGQWAGFPIRFFNDPEIPVYVLTKAASAASASTSRIKEKQGD